MNKNIEIIDGVEVDWFKFKSKAKGWNLKQSQNGYIELCKLLHENGHKLLGEYINAKTKTLIDFNCEHKPTQITPNDYKNGAKCPKCTCKSPMLAKEDLSCLLKINGHTLLSDYVNNKTKVLIDFNCGHEPNMITPNNYKMGARCPKCVGKGGQAKEDFLNMLESNKHRLIGEYINETTKVLIDFNCEHEPHLILPYAYKEGKRCPKCSAIRIATSRINQSRDNFLSVLNKNGHKLLGEYIGAKAKLLIDFNCGHEPHWITPNDYKNGFGCPLCKNKGEAALYGLLLKMDFKTEKQKTFNDLKHKKQLRYDFYLTEYNLLIELDGDHHRKPIVYDSKNIAKEARYIANLRAKLKFYDRKLKDKIKDDYAISNKIPLLRIEYNNGKIELDKWSDMIQNKINEIKHINANIKK